MTAPPSDAGQSSVGGKVVSNFGPGFFPQTQQATTWPPIHNSINSSNSSALDSIQQHPSVPLKAKRHRKRHTPPGPAGVWFQAHRHSNEPTNLGAPKRNDDDDNEHDEPPAAGGKFPSLLRPSGSAAGYSQAWMAMHVQLDLVTPMIPLHVQRPLAKYRVLRPHIPSTYAMILEVVAGRFDFQKLPLDLPCLVEQVQGSDHSNCLAILTDETGCSLRAWIQPQFVLRDQERRRKSLPILLRPGVVWMLRHCTVLVELHHNDQDPMNDDAADQPDHAPCRFERLLLISESDIQRQWTCEEAEQQISRDDYQHWERRQSALSESLLRHNCGSDAIVVPGPLTLPRSSRASSTSGSSDCCQSRVNELTAAAGTANGPQIAGKACGENPPAPSVGPGESATILPPGTMVASFDGANRLHGNGHVVSTRQAQNGPTQNPFSQFSLSVERTVGAAPGASTDAPLPLFPSVRGDRTPHQALSTAKRVPGPSGREPRGVTESSLQTVTSVGPPSGTTKSSSSEHPVSLLLQSQHAGQHDTELLHALATGKSPVQANKNRPSDQANSMPPTQEGVPIGFSGVTPSFPVRTAVPPIGGSAQAAGSAQSQLFHSAVASGETRRVGAPSAGQQDNGVGKDTPRRDNLAPKPLEIRPTLWRYVDSTYLDGFMSDDEDIAAPSGVRQTAVRNDSLNHTGSSSGSGSVSASSAPCPSTGSLFQAADRISSISGLSDDDLM
jgi:hypothetical protein